eukprot:CAMPEP_0203883760 /NCGR_PEP_ID=MMETSP0359-20131031/27836_1 /ASSEMBLY_ACC=CAM_ASM_000338 /TAXON_ID=268821 /ORGANISM="Scrippsiella Hangoei, Strain SHTV-5" /LENGTH=85 /DNA_ID=CAMNT_0050804065 /DNA_START=23 /DNA_END=281 /DNA_ORIENTATION=+
MSYALATHGQGILEASCPVSMTPELGLPIDGKALSEFPVSAVSAIKSRLAEAQHCPEPQASPAPPGGASKRLVQNGLPENMLAVA